MKKIILGLILLVMMNIPSKAKDKTYYCYDPEYNNFYTRDISVHENLSNRCQKEQQPKAIEITKDVYDKAQKMISDPSFHLWMPQHQQKLVDLISNSKEEKSVKKNDQKILCLNLRSSEVYAIIDNQPRAYAKLSDDRCSNQTLNENGEVTAIEISQEKFNSMKAAQQKFTNLKSESEKYFNTATDINKKGDSVIKNSIKDNNIAQKPKKLVDNLKFEKKCEGGLFSSGYKKGTKEFDDCISREQKLAVLEEQKLQIINEEKNKKVQQKQELDQVKIKEEQIKVSKMKPEDRYAYTCNEKFGFRKGSDKFKDCIFELYKAETELEKLELQKQVAKANADAARANAEAARAGAERQERLALAQTEAAKMQALASRQQAIAANTADSLALIESGLRMMSPQRPAPRMQTTCTYTGRFMNCF
jgi:hypothetical protein